MKKAPAGKYRGTRLSLIAVSALCLFGMSGQLVADTNPNPKVTMEAASSLASDPRYLEIVASFEEAVRVSKPAPKSVEQGKAKLSGFVSLSPAAQGFILKCYEAGKGSIDLADPKASLKRFQLGANLIGLMQDVEILEGYLAANDFPEGESFVLVWDDVDFLTTRFPTIERVLTPDIQARFHALDQVVSDRLDQNLKTARDASVVLDDLNAKMDGLLQGINAAGQ